TASAEKTFPVNDNNTGLFDQPSAAQYGAVTHVAFIGDNTGTGVIDEATANEIIEYRKTAPFQKIEDIEKVSPFLRDLYRKTRFRDLIDVRGTAYHIRSSGNVGGTIRTVDAIGARSGNDIQWRFRRLE
ncbi:MAG: hypothetical protein M1550_05330, partial [Deltaproteobacteria bacterium]|nr:hypothetical protein [Deltaproteobacteria bacterium]